MKVIVRILNEIFDFFCGDWRIFWGTAITVCIVLLSLHSGILSGTKWLAGIIFIIGVGLSLVLALKREIPKED